MNKTLIFDFDGTICDSLGPSLEIINQFSDQFGYRKVSAEEIPSLREKPHGEIFRIIGLSWVKLPKVIQKVRSELFKTAHTLTPILGIPEALFALKERGYRIGILTSNSEENVQRFIESNDLNVFEFVYSGTSFLGKAKVLKKLMKKHKVLPAHVAYVGDEVRDIEAARAVGIKIISVGWGFSSRSLLQNALPDLILDHPGELLDLNLWRN